MKNQLTLLLAVTAASLAGCASSPKDTSPQQDTSLIRSSYQISGAILPSASGSEVRYTRADRQRTDENLEFDSWFIRQLAGPADSASIVRLDRNLIWDLDKEEETYTECPLSGCNEPGLWDSVRAGNRPADSSDNRGDSAPAYDPTGSDSCHLTPLKPEFRVTEKARGRVINGFTANQYILSLEMGMKDDAGRQDTHLVTMDFWMTAESPQIRAALAMEDQFSSALFNAISPQNPLDHFVNAEIYSLLAGMLAGNQDLRDLADQLNAVQGYPVSVKMEWYADSNTCPDTETGEQKAAASSFDVSDPVGSLGSMAGGFLSGLAKEKVAAHFRPSADKPVLSYIHEVKEIRVSPERDSLFAVPPGYDIADRR